jgi:hypothetical protein
MLHVLQQRCAVLQLSRNLVESPGRNTEELKSHLLPCFYLTT